MMASPPPGGVLALHPTSRGLGWILLTGPFSPHDWGTMRLKKDQKNERCLTFVEQLVDMYHPETVVLEAFEARSSSRSERIARLGRAIVALAKAQTIDVAIFTRGEVKACFSHVGAVSRQEIADAVARSLPALAAKLPKPRRPWESDNPRMAQFSAAALGLTHYQLSASRILKEIIEDAPE